MRTKLLLAVFLALPAAARAATLQEQAAQFVADYSHLYQGVYTAAQEASWKASTDVTPEHEGLRTGANQALASLTGSPYIIAQAREFLKRKAELAPQTVRELQRIWWMAAEDPGDIPETVAKRVEAESKRSSAMDSFSFCVERSSDGKACAKPTTPNEIDNILASTATDAATHLKYWLASKEIGPALKPGLVNLRGLRNEVARHFDYPSYFDLQVAWYDMTTPEMMAMLESVLKDIQPLYEQVHCYAKYELAKRYHEPAPKGPIPAQWLGNRWAQGWPGLVEGVDLDPYFKGRTPEWIVKQGEAFYTSMGLAPLPDNFWQNSDLYPVAQSLRKKNTHASAWHIDLDHNVRSLQSVEPNAEWWATVHHELGHIFYFLAYARPEVPILLRDGAMRAFHEGFGDMAAIAANQAPYLRQVGVLPKDAKIDENRWLLAEAMDSIVFLPFSAGTMTHWERDLYAGDMPPEQWNARWWQYARQYQGIAPPETRGEELCDACTKTHINDNPAYYNTYAIGTVFKYQLHDHICRNILHQDPRRCDYYGSKEVGDFLKDLLSKGATEDWRALMREKTGADLSSKAMMDYFSPLMDYLKKENKGRACGWK
ncbi:MAG: M2 family metallopeptidase [Elusimicrobia bacterium]|nr:M2 family metallopeptidase [Elusimicrobiota bacterium]